MPSKLKAKARHAFWWLTAGFLRRRYFFLLSSLMLTLALPPLLYALNFTGDFVELLLLVNLSAAALGADTEKGRTRLAIMVAGAGVLRFAGKRLQIDTASQIASLLWIALGITAAVMAVRFAFRSNRVDSEHVCAALSAYMLLGHFYGFIYWVIENTEIGSFFMAGAPMTHGQFTPQIGIYFSFVTIATLGYGDITPADPVTRGIAVSEAVIGQFYMAVLVARLVSAYAKRD